MQCVCNLLSPVTNSKVYGYDSLPSHLAGWASAEVAKQSFDPDLQRKYVIEDNLISIDCEMVAPPGEWGTTNRAILHAAWQ